MFRACMTFTLMAFFLITAFPHDSFAANTKKKKASSSKSYVSKNKKSKKNKRYAKARRYKRSGNGPDLRTLTTEKPNTEYIENPVNGVNPMETKSEL